ncbi:hypothetical protein [Breznakibacter xylanolyticus]|uniref:hypothetical protein n=1 Tax=Breznakibacter xylanolyticus TaxID=990 RepID=UPI0011B82818|nr:hypothetical protein [Breznakibacter xylanolyticus]
MKKHLRKYSKPTITSVALDQEISLIMMSWTNPDEPPPMGDDPPGSGSGASSQAASSNPFNENSFSKD